MSQAALLVARTARISVAAAALLIAIKFAAVIASGSSAVLASLADSASDLVASGMTLLAVRHAIQPPDRAHRFGHGKAEALSALSQSLFILGSAVVVVIDAGRRALDIWSSPAEPATDTTAGILAMVASMLVTLSLVMWQRRVVRRTGSVAIAADMAHYTGDVLTHAAVLTALIVIRYTGAVWVDPIAAALVAIWLVYNGYKVAKEAVDMLMDREIGHDYRARVEQIAVAHADTVAIHDLRTRKAGSDEFIEFHLEIDGRITLWHAHEIADEVEAELRTAFPRAEVSIHQEPAGLDDDRLDHRVEGRVKGRAKGGDADWC